MITVEEYDYDLHKELGFATRFARSLWNHDEAESAAGLALAQVLKLDLPSHDSFRKMLTTTVRRRVVDAFRKEYGRNKGWTDRRSGTFRNLYAKPKVIPTEDKVLTQKVEETFHEESPLSNVIIEKEIKPLLESRECKILDMLLKEYTLSEIGEILGVTNTRVCQIRGEIKKKLIDLKKT